MSESDFYIGRVVTAETGETTEEALYYDPADLTTHGVVVGMTGSGKTGLCIDILEEAALQNIPVIMIDPKGDITNTLLHFPELRSRDFQPWINADSARREGKSVEEAAAATAELWRNGLASWAIQPERIQRLADSAHFAVYTPGSDAGIPVSILASLHAPDLAWNEQREAIRDKIGSTVTAILGLVGLTDLDPVQSREHILLSAIFEQAWRQGQDLTLEELIIQTQNPPFEKLGVFEVSTFFPDKDRFGLAMKLNSILAAPSFQRWIEGAPLDIGALLTARDGRACHSVFYIAHLDDAERMFFVTLLFSAVESWMRAQKGTTSLRALLYFDEIFGYLPPIGNPSSKEPMLRLLKQARAFGVGLLLATQNPVDVDYKALSNAGSWFVGRLGTEQDKARLLDGLMNAMGAGMDRGEYDDLISRLGKRVFLLRNVHDKAPQLFQTRWAMNYLAGPMTRAQLPALNDLVGAAPPAAAAAATTVAPATPSALSSDAAPAAPPAASPPPEAALPGHRSRPAVPSRVAEYLMAERLSPRAALEAAGLGHLADSAVTLLYEPHLLAQADVRYNQGKYGLDVLRQRSVILSDRDADGRVAWDAHRVVPLPDGDLNADPSDAARYLSPEGPLADGKTIKVLQSDFEEWIYRTGTVIVRANEALGLFATPEESEEAFVRRLHQAATEKAEAEIAKAEEKFDKEIDRLEEKLRREQRELSDDEAEYEARKREEMGSYATTVFDLFRKRRGSSSVNRSLSKRRMTENAKRDVEESREEIAQLEQDLREMESRHGQSLYEIKQKWDAVATERQTIEVSPYKKDIAVTHFGILWLPHYVIDDNGIDRRVAAVEITPYRAPAT